MKKYEFTGETKQFGPLTLKRIRLIKNRCPGGWIESEDNLSQEGSCFLYGNAQVHGKARIYGDALVYGDVYIYGNARVYGNSIVAGEARVFGSARIYGRAQVSGNLHIYGKARIFKNASINTCVVICGNAKIGTSLDWISLSFGHYLITITKANVVIGCEVYSHKQINKATKKWATAKGFPEEFYKVLAPRIKSLVRCVGVKKA
jgi:NDP-sugar pyrophosphorylase family protein